MSYSIERHRLSGETCTTYKDVSLVWKGHLCEGANLTPPRDDNFCLWTRCQQHDVPADNATTGSLADVHCSACAEVFRKEQAT